MDDSLELFSAFGNVAFALVLAVAAGAGWTSLRRSSRSRRWAIATLAAMCVGVALIFGAHLALAAIGEPEQVIVGVEPATITTHRRWTPSQIGRAHV